MPSVTTATHTVFLAEVQTSELELPMGILLLLQPPRQTAASSADRQLRNTLKNSNYLLLQSLDNTEHSSQVALLIF